MVNTEIEKTKVFFIAGIIDYVPHSISVKTIIKKITGNVCAISADTGEALTAKISPFDTFIQVIDGKAEVIIEGDSHMLVNGDCIIIPAHAHNVIRANVRFKILTTVIKSGYEDLI